MTDNEQAERASRERWLQMMSARDWRIERDRFGGVTRLVHRETGAEVAGTAVHDWVRLGVEPPHDNVRARIDELTAVLCRIADLAKIGEQLPTAANFRNIRQHAERALGSVNYE